MVTKDIKPSLIFLHGFGGRSEQWSRVFPLLDNYFQCIAIDLPGHGKNKQSVAESANDLIIKTIDLTEAKEVAVLAHSYSGFLALDAALDSRVKWLCLVGSALEIKIHPSLLLQWEKREWDVNFIRSCLRKKDGLNEAELLAGFKSLGSATSNVWGIADQRSVPLLPKTCQVTVLVPALDRVVSPRKGRALAESIPNATLKILADSDHYVHLDMPEYFSQHVIEAAIEAHYLE